MRDGPRTCSLLAWGLVFSKSRQLHRVEILSQQSKSEDTTLLVWEWHHQDVMNAAPS